MRSALKRHPSVGIAPLHPGDPLARQAIGVAIVVQRDDVIVKDT